MKKLSILIALLTLIACGEKEEDSAQEEAKDTSAEDSGE